MIDRADLNELSPQELIVALFQSCREELWANGSQGAISVEKELVQYVTPDGVRARWLNKEDISVYDFRENEFIDPESKRSPSRFSQCLKTIHWHRNAKVAFLTRSPHAVLTSILGHQTTFKVSYLVDITRIPKVTEPGFFGYADKLKIPIVEFVSEPSELQTHITKALEEHPETPAVLVRGLGVFTWGSDVWQALEIHDALESIFEITSILKTNKLPPPQNIRKQKMVVIALLVGLNILIILAVVIPVSVATTRH